MPANVDAIATAAAAKYKAKSLEARTATTIDAALAKQEEGFKEAIALAFQMFMEQAEVNGGTCTPNGPIAMAKIT